MIPNVKVLSLFLAVSLAAQASPADPGKAAIEFLEKVRDGKINLEPGGDTALSPQTADTKRRQIAKRLERVARDLGKDPLEIGAVKLDEDFAAVLIRKVGGFDTSRLQVFPVALVKKDTGWEAAPLLASFENSGAGYAIALRKRLEQLENWMLREQVLDLENLREQANARLRVRIEAKLSTAQLRKFDAKEIGERFVAACGSGDLPSLLGVLGGLGSKLPDDWSTRLKASENAISDGAQAPGPWRLMVAPDVARALVHHETEGDTGLISIACLDPLGGKGDKPRLELVNLSLSRSIEGLWRIDPPSSFLAEIGKASLKQPEDEENDQAAASTPPEALNRFPALWAAAHPVAPQPTAELAAQAWLTALNGGSFGSFLANTRIEDGADATIKPCLKAAQIWRTIRGGSAELALPLAFMTGESSAVGIYQFLIAKDSNQLDARTIYFEKSATGWLWSPEPSTSVLDSQMPWLADQMKNLPETWQQLALSGCPIIADVNGLEAVSEEEARICATTWLDSVRRGDIVQVLSRTACLSSLRSTASALQNLGYEIAGLRGKQELPSITAVYRANPWSAVGARIPRDGGKPAYPLYTVVRTPQGPRVLAEIDLFASDKRSRDFLNNEVLKRLAKTTSEDAASELRKLLESHQTGIREIIKVK